MINFNNEEIRHCIIFDEKSDLNVDDITIEENILLNCSSNKNWGIDEYLTIGACLIKDEDVIYTNINTITKKNENFFLSLKKCDFDYIYIYDEILRFNNSQNNKLIKELEYKNKKLMEELNTIKESQNKNSSVINKSNLENVNDAKEKFSLTNQVKEAIVIDPSISKFGLKLSDFNVIRDGWSMKILFEVEKYKVVPKVNFLNVLKLDFEVFNHENKILDCQGLPLYLENLSKKIEKCSFLSLNLAEIKKIVVKAYPI